MKFTESKGQIMDLLNTKEACYGAQARTRSLSEELKDTQHTATSHVAQ